MCLLPLKCLKCWVTFSAVLSLILGVVAAIVAGVQMSGVASNLLPDEFKSMASGATYAFLAFGILLILIGIAGIIGSIKNIDCCLHIFNIGTCVFFFIFLILAIVLLVSVNGLGNMRNLQECESSTIFGAWDKWERTGYNTLCTNACKCKIYKDSQIIKDATSSNFTRKIPFVYEGIDRPAKAAASNSTTVSTTKAFAEFFETGPVAFQTAGATTTQPAATTNTTAQPAAPAQPVGPSPVRFQQCPDYAKIANGRQSILEEASGLKWTEIKQAAPAANTTANTTTAPKPARFLQSTAPATTGTTAGATTGATTGAAATSNTTAAAPAATAAPYVSKPLNYTIPSAVEGTAFVAFGGTLNLLESTLNCAGVCEKRVFYSFSDINDEELPSDSCGGKLYDYIVSLGQAIGIASLIIAIFLLINVILALCLTKANNAEDKK